MDVVSCRQALYFMFNIKVDRYGSGDQNAGRRANKEYHDVVFFSFKYQAIFVAQGQKDHPGHHSFAGIAYSANPCLSL